MRIHRHVSVCFPLVSNNVNNNNINNNNNNNNINNINNNNNTNITKFHNIIIIKI